LAGRRDKAILELLYSTGLRVSELCKLNRDMVNLDRREFGVVGKGGRARVVFLSKRAADWIDFILAGRETTVTRHFSSSIEVNRTRQLLMRK